ncbi:DUF5305 domain-containing protein [Halostella sp. JP-L12]|uniref:DUF5305 family protein n=1 Tax=Halostella TaxID=1843185 RepID=UPI000EF77E52|nr:MULTISPECIES: DUF5305 family protein [Halostella]NHN48615.1 DUF5305 domain-containing protein [Halostella sp. JP-L12]
MSGDLPPRVRLLAARYGRELAVALAVVALVALAAAGAAVANSSTTVTEERNVQTVSTSVETSAVVTAEDSAWETGTRLENSPRYLRRDAPELTLTPTTRAPDGTSVTHEVRLELRATADGEPYWNSSRVLVSETTEATNGTATATATVDVPALAERVNETAHRLSHVGSMEVRLRVVTTYDTGDYVGELAASAPLQVTDRAYWVDGDLAADRTHRTTVSRRADAAPDYPTVLSLLALAGGAAAAAATLWRRREAAVDVDAIRQEIHRKRHAEWISAGSIPMWIDRDRVRLNTLEDVVDVAIDGDGRVVHDERWDLFAVFDGDVVYYYCRTGEWEEIAWPSVGATDGVAGAGEGPQGIGGSGGDPPDDDSDDGLPVDEDAWGRV